MELELFYGGRYFKGDSIRLCLAYAGLGFEDIRQGHARWVEFDAMKAAGELPFGQMPVLRVGGAGGTLCAPTTTSTRPQTPPPPNPNLLRPPSKNFPNTPMPQPKHTTPPNTGPSTSLRLHDHSACAEMCEPVRARFR